MLADPNDESPANVDAAVSNILYCTNLDYYIISTVFTDINCNTVERVEGKLCRIQEKGGEVCQKEPRGVFVGDEQLFKWKDLFNSGKFYNAFTN